MKVDEYEIPPHLPPGNRWRFRIALTNAASVFINGLLVFDRIRDGSDVLAFLHTFCVVVGVWCFVDLLVRYVREVREWRAWRREYLAILADVIGRELARRDADE